MIALPPRIWTVADLMQDRHLTSDDLAAHTGLESTVVDAVIHQRYTPSLEQRLRISAALGVSRRQIVWGHVNAVDHDIRLVC